MKQKKIKRLAAIEKYLGAPLVVGGVLVRQEMKHKRKDQAIWCGGFSLTVLETITLVEQLCARTIEHSFFVDQLFSLVNTKEEARKPVFTADTVRFQRLVDHDVGVHDVGVGWRRPCDVIVPRNLSYPQTLRQVRDGDYGELLDDLLATERFGAQVDK